MAEDSIPTYQTVSECQQALEAARAESLRHLADWLECHRRAKQAEKLTRRRKRDRKKARQQCLDRIAEIETLRDLIDSSPDGLRVVIRRPEHAGSFVRRLGEILDGEETPETKAEALRRLANEADAWLGQHKPANAAVEALADYAARAETDPPANVIKYAAEIRSKAENGIW